MKKTLAFLLLVMLGMRLGAQVVGPPDPYGPSLYFFTDFLPLDDSPPDSDIQGGAVYYREQHIPPNYPVYTDYTNILSVYVSFTTPPEAVWVLEKETNGTFSQIAQITNFLNDSVLEQRLILTVDQVHSLVSGNWYEEVDFGTSNYLGSLAPDYDSARGPRIVDVTVQPIYTLTPHFYPLQFFRDAIATNNHAAKVVFDGSQTVDAFYLPLEYSWIAWTNGTLPVFTNSGVLVTNVVPVGEYTVSLTAEDALATGWPYAFYLNVITPKQAVERSEWILGFFSLPKQQKLILTGVLSIAANQFDRGQTRQGCAQLEFYLGLVKMFHLPTETTHGISVPVQDILNAYGIQNQWRN